MLDAALQDYLAMLHRNKALPAELEARTREVGLDPSAALGQLCHQWAMAVGARDVFELGSGVGYLTWWLARAVGERGRVVFSEPDEGRAGEARRLLERAGLYGRVQVETGEPVLLLEAYPGPFDLACVDVGRGGAPHGLAELVAARVRVGGVVIGHGVLAGGAVLQPTAQQDEKTRAAARWLKDLFALSELHTTVSPVGGGVSVSLKVAAEPKRRR